ncbi:hypothetical protein [Streptomyces palmae]|uniref:hypothetical protein n=1 Tax=Streptomyces palmae TaxID=1701085 RepID=UPI001433275D|nr:hypothetical protein [Streptomyces palmae]
MGFTEEWATAKAEVGARMRLDGAGSSPGVKEYGSAVSDLHIKKGALRGLATDTETLKHHVGTALADLQEAHHSLATDTSGLASTSTLAKVRESWEKRLKDARKECGELGQAFRNAGGLHEGNDSGVRSKFASVKVSGVNDSKQGAHG